MVKFLYSSGGGKSSTGWKSNLDSKSSILDLEEEECPLRMGGGGGGGPVREEDEGGGGGLGPRVWWGGSEEVVLGATALWIR